MQALLFADRAGKGLLPLTEHTCVALLPVAGKPLIVFALEDLALAGIHEVMVVASSHADLIEKELGHGERWGIRLEYGFARDDERPEVVTSKVAGYLSEWFLMMRGDVLRSSHTKRFLELGAANGYTPAEAVYGGRPAAMRLCRQGEPQSWRLQSDSELEAPVPGEHRQIQVPDAKVSMVLSLAQYHQANLDAAAGRIPGLLIPGREIAPQVRIGRQSRLPAGAVKGKPVFVGSRCRIDNSAELFDEVVVNDDVIIDRRAILRSAVVLPQTYIGELVEVSDSIVSTNYLISGPRWSVTRVIDSFLLSNLKRLNYSGGLAGVLNRFVGFLLLILSTPLWPLMIVTSLSARPGQPLRSLRLDGNKVDLIDGIPRRRCFTTAESATSIPILKWLTLLLAVVSGDLRLIGVEALSPDAEEALSAEWEKLRQEAPVGLIGPAQLLLQPYAPADE